MSSNKRYDAKRDANEQEIVDYLLAVGCSVDRLNGKGTPDLLVGYRGLNLLIEIKMPDKKLNKIQTHWFSNWRGTRPWIVRSVSDAEVVLSGYSDRN